jgi:hypothetical protein
MRRTGVKEKIKKMKKNWRNIYSTSATTIYTIIIVIKAQEIIVIS